MINQACLNWILRMATELTHQHHRTILLPPCTNTIIVCAIHSSSSRCRHGGGRENELQQGLLAGREVREVLKRGGGVEQQQQLECLDRLVGSRGGGRILEGWRSREGKEAIGKYD